MSQIKISKKPKMGANILKPLDTNTILNVPSVTSATRAKNIRIGISIQVTTYPSNNSIIPYLILIIWRLCAPIPTSSCL